MGTVSDIRSRKKDDIVGASHLFMSLNEEYEIRKISFFSKIDGNMVSGGHDSIENARRRIGAHKK